jgi:predicted metal-dependent TIM-barrel fold hydrolase
MEIDWNAMAGVKKRSHNSAQISFTIGLHPDASPDDIEGEVEDLKMKIKEIIEDAIDDRTTLITGIHFNS